MFWINSVFAIIVLALAYVRSKANLRLAGEEEAQKARIEEFGEDRPPLVNPGESVEK